MTNKQAAWTEANGTSGAAFRFLKGRSVLVTGGTGSFGQAFVKALLHHGRPSRLAVFSRDEIHSLPAEMHTQVTKDGEQVTLKVLTSLDLKLIQLRKVDGRNRNDVTIVAALFDVNGNFIAGKQKLLKLRLRDETVRGSEQKPPIVIATGFEVKPGAYLVRLVVRDEESREITAENAAAQIP